jgi:hypothetical protein
MRLATTLALLLLAAALLGGCGSSSPPSRQGTSGGSEGAGAPVPKRQAAAPAGAGVQSCETDAADAAALRAVGVSCGQARRVMFAWQRSRACAPGGASRSGCGARSYRCQATRSARGLAVDCARPGASIAFTVKPR